MTEVLWKESDWNFEKIQKVYDACEEIAIKELKLNTYPNQIEIISSEQMLDAYASIGMPIFYKHWSFGKHFLSNQKSYQKGHSGLAFEIVINSSPTINYLMEDNTMTTQALVIAHAAFGHNHFFKNNYLFKQWTDAEGIIDYLIFAKDYINEQEIKHGRGNVERWLDSCHALMDYGVSRYKRPSKISKEKEKERQRERSEYLQKRVTEFYRLLPPEPGSIDDNSPIKKFPEQPEENLLYFFEKYSPDLDIWQREILRIVRKIAQYFYPQGQTKVMNEGFASLVHYEIMNRLHDKGLTTEAAHLEFLDLHSSVLTQLPYSSKYFHGFNPYKLGFTMLRDIQRMCQNPTAEDLEYFPSIKNADSWDIILDSVENYRDESFIRQWLSPKVMRDLKLFSLFDDRKDTEKYVVKNIHNKSGYEALKEQLADQYLESVMVPRLEVDNLNKRNRTLTLKYTSHRGSRLSNIEKMLPHLRNLWSNHKIEIRDESGLLIGYI
jgi:stage V sporulation protein R